MRTTQENHPEAPRAKLKSHRIVTNAFWNRIRKKCPKYKDYSDSQLLAILKKIHNEFHKPIIQDRLGVELPNRLGVILCFTCDPKTSDNIDHGLTNKYKMEIHSRNGNSDDYILKIAYVNGFARYKFKFYKTWKFESCRNLTQAASASYPEKYLDYIHLKKQDLITKLLEGIKFYSPDKHESVDDILKIK